MKDLSRLQPLFDSVDTRQKKEIGFDQFYELVKKIIWEDQVKPI